MSGLEITLIVAVVIMLWFLRDLIINKLSCERFKKDTDVESTIYKDYTNNINQTQRMLIFNIAVSFKYMNDRDFQARVMEQTELKEFLSTSSHIFSLLKNFSEQMSFEENDKLANDALDFFKNDVKEYIKDNKKISKERLDEMYLSINTCSIDKKGK